MTTYGRKLLKSVIASRHAAVQPPKVRQFPAASILAVLAAIALIAAVSVHRELTILHRMERFEVAEAEQIGADAVEQDFGRYVDELAHPYQQAPVWRKPPMRQTHIYLAIVVAKGRRQMNYVFDRMDPRPTRNRRRDPLPGGEPLDIWELPG